MIVTFVHDHKFRVDSNKYYSTGGLSLSQLNRYHDIFGSLNVLSRVIKKTDSDKHLTLSSGEDITFIHIPDYMKPSKLHLLPKAISIIKNQVRISNLLIIRLPSINGFIANYFARKYRIKTIIELVACPWDAFWNNLYYMKIISPIAYLYTRRVVKKSNFVIYVTNNFLQRRYPTIGKSTSISNVELIRSVSNVNVNADFNLSDFKMGTIGALDVKYKGHRFVIKAMHILKNKHNININYYLVGQGNNRNLAKLVKKLKLSENVHFVGSLPHEKIFEWMKSIDVYCQPSQQEGLPRALIEAMSCSKPCIGSNAGGIPELLDKTFIFAKGKSKSIVNLLTSVDITLLKQSAERNLRKSIEYEKEILNTKRKKFFLEAVNNEN